MMTETTIMTEEEGAGATAIGDQGAEVEVEVHGKSDILHVVMNFLSLSS